MPCKHPKPAKVWNNPDNIPSEVWDKSSIPYISNSTVLMCWDCEMVLEQVSNEPFETWWDGVSQPL